jgi:Cdc6-like AAA superfamily ATPase
MSNPRDWFRRRRSPQQNGASAPAGDPFAQDHVLDLGGSGTLLLDEPRLDTRAHDAPPRRSAERLAPDRTIPDHPVPERLRDERPTSERGSVPPPPPRPTSLRHEGRVIERSAFAVRPEVVRSGPGTDAVPPVARRPEPPQAVNPPATPIDAAGGERREGSVADLSARRNAAFRIGPTAPTARPNPGRDQASGRPTRAPAAARADNQSGSPADEDAGEGNAAFSLAAPGVSWMRSRTVVPDAGHLNALLREAFTPTRPKQSTTLFSGRYKQMQRIIAAIEEERAHVVVYGERGSGKTSLANVLAAKAEEAGYFVLRFACSSELTFEDIFRNFLRRIPSTFLADGIGASARSGLENFEQLLPGPQFGIADLVAVFERIYDRHVVLIIDEYDRVTSHEAKNKLAELIKIMSDAAAPVTLLLIGVADDVQELFGKHPSLQRTLVTVPMPLMTKREIDGIIASGEQKSGLSFEPAVRQAIVEFAQGLPYHAQLLGLFAARSAVRRRSDRVERQDLRYAVLRAAEEAESRVKEAYNLAIGSQDNTSFQDVLFYAARSRTDEFGTFTAADVAAAGRTEQEEIPLLSLQYPLKKLTEPERGAVLRRIAGPGGLRYQFASQMLRHHVLVRQAEQRGLI